MSQSQPCLTTESEALIARGSWHASAPIRAWLEYRHPRKWYVEATPTRFSGFTCEFVTREHGFLRWPLKALW